MAQLVKSASPEKQSGVSSKTSTDISTKSQVAPMADTDSICLSVDNVQSVEHLKMFMSFLCDKQATDLVTAIRSSIELFSYCIPSREAVLLFYNDLFTEHSTYYWINKKRSLTTIQNSNINDQQNKTKIEYAGELTRRFFEMEKLKLADAREDQAISDNEESVSKISVIPRSSPSKSISSHLTGPESPTASCSHMSPAKGLSGPKEIPTSRRTSSCNSNDMEQTPMSPSAQDGDIQKDDEMLCSNETDTVDIFSELEKQISLVRAAFMNLINKYKLNSLGSELSETTNSQSSHLRQRERFKNLITRWASDLLIQLNSKHAEISAMVANDQSKSKPSLFLTKQIELWTTNPVNKLLVDIILESHFDVRHLFDRLTASNQNCDWLLAYTLLEMSKNSIHEKNFTQCLDYIISGSCDINSLTYILAYMSDNNPKAMTNFPKSNIPFLISMCQTSVSLLNVLALEIPDEINPEFLNNLAKEIFRKVPSKNQPGCIEGLTHCIIAAPNSYKLFLLTFDVMQNDKINADVKSATRVIIDSILLKIQQRTMTGLPISNVTISNPQVPNVDCLLNQINNDPAKLINKSMTYKYLAKKALSIFNFMSLLYGNTVASTIIAHHLNLPEKYSWTLLKPLLSRFMENFNDDGSTLVSKTLSLDLSLRTPTYWKNLYNLSITMPNIKLDLDLISQLIVDKLCAATLDIDSIAQLIKLCTNSVERVDHTRIRISTKHKLCMSLATSFFILLEMDGGEEFPKILSYIRVSLTCMSLLKQSNVASHIMCRALLERSLVYGHLFNKDFDPDIVGTCVETSDWSRDDTIKLSRENLKVSLGHRFRRLPNHRAERETISNGFKRKKLDQEEKTVDSDKPDRQSMNSYLLIEAFKSSINNIDAFADLFVEFHCPVMFEKHSWPSDDSLRVISEKNLGILRKFEQVPPFWDLYELIGQAKCLKNCLVLVKALLAAHLAMWASATAKSCPDKMHSTTRLIPPLAESGLVPKAFGLTVEVLAHLSPNEVFAVLSDLWQYLKDTLLHVDESATRDEVLDKAKLYLTRLRLFMCQHMPGSTYVKIFKELYKPAPKTIPT